MRTTSLGPAIVAFAVLSCSGGSDTTAEPPTDTGGGGTATPDAATGGHAGGSGGAAGRDAGKGGSSNSGGSVSTGGSANSGGSVSTGGSANTGGSTNTGGSVSDAAAGGGFIWYDGEPGGFPLSAGTAGLSGGSTATETSSNPHGGSNCLSVSLNATGGWAHLGWDPSKNSTTYDLTAYTNLEFWIRSASGTLTDLQMEMHGTSGGCAWIWIRDYLSGGVTTTWQKVTIPLTAFQLDRTSVHTIDFWLGSGTAAFFIDDGRCI